jgi:DNA-binding protein H-NS
MSVEELWGIHEEVSKLLEARMLAEKEMLERRLLSLRHPTAGGLKARRPYPPVHPKFANPDEPTQVWTGRGKQPRWVTEKLASGLALEDLSIGRGSSVVMPEQRE